MKVHKLLCIAGTLLFILACVVLCGIAQAAEFAGASGMAWVSGNSYLCVQDTKSNVEGSRVGILTVDTDKGGYDYLPLEPDWGKDLPHDLESVYAFRERPGEFLLAESGSYENWTTHEYHIGRIFHVKLEEEQGGWLFSILGTIPIPEKIHEMEGMISTKVPDQDYFEKKLNLFGDYPAIDEDTFNYIGDFFMSEEQASGGNQQLSDMLAPDREIPRRDLIYIVMGSRGGNEAFEPAMLYTMIVDLNSSETRFMNKGRGQVFSVPPQDNPFERGISDLYLDRVGVLWVASCSDRGDSGPFDSEIRRVGLFNPEGYMGSSYDTYRVPSWFLSGLKVEALCSSVFEGNTLSYATDDEGFGGIWRSLGAANPRP